LLVNDRVLSGIGRQVFSGSEGIQRICIYIPTLHGGGAERMMVNLANDLTARGYIVDLVLVEARGPYLAEIAPAVSVVDLAAGGVISSLPAFASHLSKTRPAVVISALSHANLIAILARMLSRVPCRLIISERSVLFAPGMPERSWKDGLVRLLMKLLYPFADQIVAISRGVQDDLHKWIGLPPGKVRTIYNPVVTAELPELAAAPVPHAWLAKGEPPVILGVGRLTAQKDFASLIRAFAVVRKERPCRLVILGEGELRADLEALVSEFDLKDDVLMPGFHNNPFAWMSRSAVFVFSSIFEGLGGALIQAMACGTPVISTDCPSGPAEILEDGKWGRLVPVGDVQGLARAIRFTLAADSHPDVRMRAAFFSDKRSVNEYLEVCFPDLAADRSGAQAKCP